MKRIRIGNDFAFAWSIEHGGAGEKLQEATGIKLLLRSVGGSRELTEYIIVGNVLSVEFTPELLPRTGVYQLQLSYEVADAGFEDGKRKNALDIDAFEIVARSAAADESFDIAVTSDVAIGFRGDAFKYSDFTPEQLEALKVKGDKGDPFLYSDFTQEQIAELQKPATDAAIAVNEAEALRMTAETTRVGNEQGRVTAEGTRQSNEIARGNSEDDREDAESLRLSAEVTRGQNEQARITAEGLRVTAESTRQTNTATAITNANNAATNANTKAGLANDAANNANTKATLANDAAILANEKAGLADTAATNADNARLSIQTDLGLKANHGYANIGSAKTLKQVDDNLAQLESDVEQLAYVKIKNEVINGNFENGLIAPFSKTDGSGGKSTLAINSSTPISGNYDIRFTITTPATSGGRPSLAGLNRAGNIGDKIYLHFYAKILSGTPNIRTIHNGETTNSIYAGNVINGRNTRIINVAGTDGNLGRIYFDSLSAVWDMQMDNFMRINLTETFGAGNEPTEKEMNLLLDMLPVDYFEGEITIPAQKVMQWQLKLANTSVQNAEDARLAIQDDLTRIEDDVREVREVAHNPLIGNEYVPAGTNFTPDVVLNSSLSDNIIWLQNTMLGNDGITTSATNWFTLANAVEIPHSGEYSLRVEVTGASRVVLTDREGGVLNNFKNSDFDEYRKITFGAKKGDKIRWCCSVTNLLVPVKEQKLEIISPVIPDTSIFASKKDLIPINGYLDELNKIYKYIPKGINITPPDMALTEGYLNINTGAHVASTDYSYTSHIPVPKGASIKVWPGVANGITHNGVYLYLNGIFIRGYNYLSDNFVLINSNASIYNHYLLGQDIFNSDGYTIRVVGGKEILNTYELKITMQEDLIIHEVNGVTPVSSSSNYIEVKDINKSTNLTVPHLIKDSNGNDNLSAIGLPSSQTIIKTPISNAYNIRFRFRLISDLFRENKDAVIFKGNNLEIKATREAVEQNVSTFSDGDQTKTSYEPYLLGGVSFNGDDNRLMGDFSFAIRYIGNMQNQATIENTGSVFIVKINSVVVANIDYSEVSKVSELYEQLKSLQDFEVDYNSVEERPCTDLLIFPESKLVSEYLKNETVVTDNPKFIVPYAVCNQWNEVEITTLLGITYVLVNGSMRKIPGAVLSGDNVDLIFGGHCNVLFKDIQIDTLSSRDAERIEYSGVHEQVISSFNPLILILEGHGMDTRASHEVDAHTGNMSTTPDRLQYVFELLKGKGYNPISIEDIREYYYNDKELPKRCYSLMMDDYQWSNYTDLKNRSVFTRYGAKPSLAIVTGRYPQYPIVSNNGDLSSEKAIMIAKNSGFGIYSHTKDHRHMTWDKHSMYEEKLIEDINDADRIGADPRSIIYPYGESNGYLTRMMKWVGISMGIAVVSNSVNAINRRFKGAFSLNRIEIGLRSSIQTIKNMIV